MASIHRMRRSEFWYAAFMLPDGRRTLRSTGTSDRKRAMQVAMEFDKAAKLGREGRLTEARARRVIADIFELANAEKMPAATIGDFLKLWLDAKRLEVADTSISNYAGPAAAFLEHLGSKAKRPVDSLTVRDVKSFRLALAEKYSASNANKYCAILRGAFKQAGREGLTQENIFSRVDPLAADASTARRPFTLPELTTVLGASDTEWRGIVLFGLYTGQRLGDIARATWRQVDLIRRDWTFTTSKTGRDMKIPLAEPLVEYLLTLPSADDPGAPVFPKANGAAQTTLSNQFNAILASVGLVAKKAHRKAGAGRGARRVSQGLSFHCLRHTATSMLKNAGVSDVVAREIIGHDSAAISREYTHIEPATLRDAIKKLPDIAVVHG